MREWLAVFIVLGVVVAGRACADESALCRSAVSAAEAGLHIPDAFLSAIARVESGRPDRQTGALAPWPWTINAEGQGAFFASKAEAIDAVRALQARGVRSIDVGCMQVNLMHHPEAFTSLDQAFDPASNADFAGHLLLSLFAQTRAWPRAAAAYHSQTPTVGAAYQQRVLAEWAVPEEGAAASLRSRQVRPRPSAAPLPQAPVLAISNAPMLAASEPMASRSQAGPSVGRVSAFTGRAAPAASGLGATGRGLAAYRAIPTLLATRWAPRPG